MQTKQSIDIVLLPTKNITDLSFEINKKIIAKGGEKIIFEKNKCIPHISILMGAIENGNLKPLIEIVKKIATETKQLNLKIKELLTTKIPSGENNYDFDITKTKELKLLHKKIFEKALQHFSFDATIETLYPDPTPEEITLTWINNHASKKDFDKFRPHITLGVGGEANMSLEKEIVCNIEQIGIYQLGNYCTCRKEIAILNLQK